MFQMKTSIESAITYEPIVETVFQPVKPAEGE